MAGLHSKLAPAAVIALVLLTAGGAVIHREPAETRGVESSERLGHEVTKALLEYRSGDEDSATEVRGKIAGAILSSEGLRGKVSDTRALDEYQMSLIELSEQFERGPLRLQAAYRRYFLAMHRLELAK